MRTNKLLIILLLAFTIMLILSLSACNSDTSGDINNNIDITFITCCNETEEDFQKYNNAYFQMKPLYFKKTAIGL